MNVMVRVNLRFIYNGNEIYFARVTDGRKKTADMER